MRILVISDIHGNADALGTILEDSGKWDYLWFLGDLVDYGPEPHVVVDLIKSMKPDVLVSGNHDYAVAFNTDCRCAQELHELSVYTRFNVSVKLLGRDQVEWLKTLPHRAELEIGGKKVYVVHGSPRSPLYGYLKPNLAYNELVYQLSSSMLRVKPVNADVVLVGHTRVPMDIKVNSIRVLNPGSCGQPRDGDPRASYAILDIENDSFELRRVEYDIEKVLFKLRSLKLDNVYLKWLIAIIKTGKALGRELI